jgi:hypothetical protein
MKLILGLICLCTFTCSFAQQHSYSYSFSGTIDSSFVKQLEEETMNIDGVYAAKARYKVEKQKGEIIIYSQEDDKQKDPHVFSPADVKAMLLRHNLSPGQFVQLKSSK